MTFQEMTSALEEAYCIEPLCVYHMREEDSKAFLGEMLQPRVCRFCGKMEPEASFKKVAHAIPQFTGNNRLFSYYECDNCNETFSKYESQFAGMMTLAHSLSQTHGKKGVPSYKPNIQQDSRVDVDSTGIKIKQYPDSGDFVTYNDNDGGTPTITVKGDISYRPIDIAKILTKMALTIMPEEEMDNFKVTKKWLLEKSDSPRSIIRGMAVHMFLYPGNNPFLFPTCGLYKKREDAGNEFPYMIFFLCYSNFMFQTFIPYCEKDRVAFCSSKSVGIKCPRIPNALDSKGIPSKMTLIDCSSNQIKHSSTSIHLCASEATCEHVSELKVVQKNKDGQIVS